MEVMIIDFSKIEEVTFPGMNGGTGQMTVRMYNDENTVLFPQRFIAAEALVCIGKHLVMI